MTIIQHGDEHNRYRFICDYCGCIWFADRIDIEKTQYDGIPDTPCCSCPECLKWTAGADLADEGDIQVTHWMHLPELPKEDNNAY